MVSPVNSNWTAVLAASIFHFGEFTITQAKQALASAVVSVRPSNQGGD
jgi:imidazole glycerol phosphate synthase subunit HisF